MANAKFASTSGGCSYQQTSYPARSHGAIGASVGHCERMSLFRPVQVDDTDGKDAIARVKRVAGGRARARAEAIIHA